MYENGRVSAVASYAYIFSTAAPCTECPVDIFLDKVTLKSGMASTLNTGLLLYVLCSVAEPEPVEQQLFAGAGAKIFSGPAPAPELGI
jgi:hypothetical protein